MIYKSTNYKNYDFNFIHFLIIYVNNILILLLSLQPENQ
jgi:hypothetical protein